MRIALIYLGRKGGGAQYAFEMAKALSYNHDVMCIISSYVSNLNNWEKLVIEHPAVKIKKTRTYNSFGGFIIKSLDVCRYVKIKRIINEFSPDVIYSPMGSFWERFIVPYCKCKHSVQTIHDVILHEGENNMKYKLYRCLGYYKSWKYVILSETFKNTLLKHGIAESQIIVIPHAVFKGYCNKQRIYDYTQYNRFLFFGRILKYKGIEILIEAMEQLASELPFAELIIAGEGDIMPYKTVLESLHNINLHIGWIADCDVWRFFDTIDFVVVPYIQASQSGVIALSYAFGKPVIASRIGGLPEQVEENKTGILIEPGNIEELKKAIIRLLTNHQELENLKRNCYNYSEKNSWMDSAQLLIDGIHLL